ncbi:MAG: 50S ribosomal protein L11 [Clostridia bacterium]|jgi:large subunit ribosomal protein L11|nr:50S ribosomal protein L11 [Clostridia bacterium]
MAKKPVAVVKVQLPAGKATAGQQLGGALGPHGVNIGAFIKQFNEATASQVGLVIPVIVNVYADRTFDITYKTPPAAVLIKKAVGIEKGSAKTPKEVAGTITKAQLKEIAEMKMKDLNAASVEAAMSMIAGSARSMGVKVADDE